MTPSPFTTLFLSIMNHLKTKVHEIKWIDQDLGQLEQEGRPPVAFPCVLIDFSNWQYEDWADNTQKGTGFVTIRIAFDAWSNTNNITSPMWQNKGLSFYDLEYKIFKALHGWKPPHSDNSVYDYLMRTNVDKEEREDNLRVRTIVFSCGYEDRGASPSYIKTPLPGPEFVPPKKEEWKPGVKEIAVKW